MQVLFIRWNSNIKISRSPRAPLRSHELSSEENRQELKNHIPTSSTYLATTTFIAGYLPILIPRLISNSNDSSETDISASSPSSSIASSSILLRRRRQSRSRYVMESIGCFGAGLLMGSALGIIIPEGVEAIFEARDRSMDLSGIGVGVSSIPGRRLLRAKTRKSKRQFGAETLPLPGAFEPDRNLEMFQGDFGEAIGNPNGDEEGMEGTEGGGSDGAGWDPGATVGLALLLGFGAMYLLDHLQSSIFPHSHPHSNYPPRRLSQTTPHPKRRTASLSRPTSAVMLHSRSHSPLPSSSPNLTGRDLDPESFKPRSMIINGSSSTTSGWGNESQDFSDPRGGSEGVVDDDDYDSPSDANNPHQRLLNDHDPNYNHSQLSQSSSASASTLLQQQHQHQKTISGNLRPPLSSLTGRFSPRHSGFSSSPPPGPSPSHKSTILALLIHSLADGISLGASASYSSSLASSLSITVFMAIAIHKLPAAFGLTSRLLSPSSSSSSSPTTTIEPLSKTHIRRALLAFSAAAPIGAVITWFLVSLIGGGGTSTTGDETTLEYWTGAALLFSGGTFLFVAVQGLGEHAAPNADGGGGGESDEWDDGVDGYGERGMVGKKMKLGLVVGGMGTPWLLARAVGGHHG